ncbi:MAG: hypothetical protein ACK55I_39200, partial [bacterium]
MRLALAVGAVDVEVRETLEEVGGDAHCCMLAALRLATVARSVPRLVANEAVEIARGATLVEKHHLRARAECPPDLGACRAIHTCGAPSRLRHGKGMAHLLGHHSAMNLLPFELAAAPTRRDRLRLRDRQPTVGRYCVH